MTDDNPLKVLVLGSAYGMLPGVKLSLAGHHVTLVGKRDEIAQMAQGRLTVTLPLRQSAQGIELGVDVALHAGAAAIALRVPDDVDPAEYDFAILAMQEPQFAVADVGDLMRRIAAARLPCLSIMNLPPRPYLASLDGIPRKALDGVYASEAVWTAFPPDLLTVACPDPQAIRVDPEKPGELLVTLASNFKAAPFADAAAQALLERLAHDMSRLKVGGVRPPVFLLAKQSRYIPLAKWPMLLAGNFRCLHGGQLRSIAQAIGDDPQEARSVFDAVYALVRSLGAPEADLVSFDTYAGAAKGLVRPSSVARALVGGAVNVERIDRLIQNLLEGQGHSVTAIDAIVAQTDAALAVNRAGG